MEVLSSRTIIRPTDLERSLEFYGDQLGLAVARQFGTGPSRGVVFFVGGGFLEVVGHGGPTEGGGSAGVDRSVPVPPLVLWLQVRDVTVTVAELAERGVPIVRPPLREPWGLVEAWVDDPDGLRIHLVEVPADHPLRRDVRSPDPS